MAGARTNETDAAFVRGYLAAVAEIARWNGQIKPSDLLGAANITRDVAAQAKVSEHDLKILDNHVGAWPK